MSSGRQQMSIQPMRVRAFEVLRPILGAFLCGRAPGRFVRPNLFLGYGRQVAPEVAEKQDILCGLVERADAVDISDADGLMSWYF